MRARFAAFAAAFGLRGMLLNLGRSVNGIPVSVRCEVDEYVDDAEVTFHDGSRALVQVKLQLTLDLTKGKPLHGVMEQLVGQCRAVPADETPLVAVCARGSKGIIDLASALESRRDPHAGAPTSAEAAALANFGTGVDRIDPGLTDQVLDRFSIVLLDLAADSGSHWVTGAGLLDGNVVASGQGGAAFKLLEAAYRQAAARRSGLDLEGWMAALEVGKLDLSVDQRGGASAVRAAELAAVRRYKARVAEGGSKVDLSSVGIPLAPIAAVRLHRVRRHDIDDNEKGGDVVGVLRRHGRILLLGVPGCGKSTMLRQLASNEAAKGWCLPLVVDLRGLLDVTPGSTRPMLYSTHDPLDLLISLALADAPAVDRPLLHKAARRAASDGSLLVCLDALDETRQHRHAVVAWVQRLVASIHSGSDIVLATRSSAYASARILGWPEFSVDEVLRPYFLDIARNVLGGIASRNGHDSTWVAVREDWIRQQTSEIPMESYTPLLAVVLAAEAAAGSLITEKVSYAGMLERAIARIARSWERSSSRIPVELPALHSDQLTLALQTAITYISWQIAISGKMPVNTVTVQLSGLFAAEHGLSPAVARTLAKSAIHFWDEAGIVVIQDNGLLSSSTRHVIELAAARHAISMPHAELAEAVKRLSAEPTLLEILCLMAALDAESVRSAVESGARSGSYELLFVILTGFSHNADSPPDLVQATIDALVDCESQRRVEPTKLAALLAKLPASFIETRQLSAAIETLVPPPMFPIWAALVAHRRNTADAKESCRQIVLQGPPIPSPARQDVMHRVLGYHRINAESSGTHGAAFSEVVLGAAMRLTDTEPELAERIQHLADTYCDVFDTADILQELGKRAYPSDRPSMRPSDKADLTELIESHSLAIETLLQRLAGHDHRYQLRVDERRRLALISTLFGILFQGDAPMDDLTRTVEFFYADFATIVDLAIDLCSIDRSILAAECRQVLSEIETNTGLPAADDPRMRVLDATQPLYFDPPQPNVTWQQDLLVTTVEQLVPRLATTVTLAGASAALLSRLPHEHRTHTAIQTAAIASSTIREELRRIAAHLTLDLDPSHSINWASSADPLLAVFTVERFRKHPEPEALLVAALTSENTLIRDAAAFEITFNAVITPPIATALRQALSLPDVGTCRHCGAEYANTLICGNCRNRLPDPRTLIARLVGVSLLPDDEEPIGDRIGAPIITGASIDDPRSNS